MKVFLLICFSSIFINGVAVYFNIIEKKAWIPMSIGLVVIHYIGKWYNDKYNKDKK